MEDCSQQSRSVPRTVRRWSAPAAPTSTAATATATAKDTNISDSPSELPVPSKHSTSTETTQDAREHTSVAPRPSKPWSPISSPDNRHPDPPWSPILSCAKTLGVTARGRNLSAAAAKGADSPEDTINTRSEAHCRGSCGSTRNLSDPSSQRTLGESDHESAAENPDRSWKASAARVPPLRLDDAIARGEKFLHGMRHKGLASGARRVSDTARRCSSTQPRVVFSNYRRPKVRRSSADSRGARFQERPVCPVMAGNVQRPKGLSAGASIVLAFGEITLKVKGVAREDVKFCGS